MLQFKLPFQWILLYLLPCAWPKWEWQWAWACLHLWLLRHPALQGWLWVNYYCTSICSTIIPATTAKISWYNAYIFHHQCSWIILYLYYSCWYHKFQIPKFTSAHDTPSGSTSIPPLDPTKAAQESTHFGSFAEAARVRKERQQSHLRNINSSAFDPASQVWYSASFCGCD